MGTGTEKNARYLCTFIPKTTLPEGSVESYCIYFDSTCDLTEPPLFLPELVLNDVLRDGAVRLRAPHVDQVVIAAGRQVAQVGRPAEAADLEQTRKREQ